MNIFKNHHNAVFKRTSNITGTQNPQGHIDRTLNKDWILKYLEFPPLAFNVNQQDSIIAS